MGKEIYFFIRDDDVAEMNDKFLNFYNLMEELEIPVIYSIIPGLIKQEIIDFFNQNKGNFSIAQHGFMHDNHGGEKKYEFGDSRSYEQQLEDIKKGQEIISENFGIKEKVFVPPYHNFDNNTINALKKLG